MHIPDAILDPRVAMATSVLGAAGLFHALRVVERQLKERTTSLMGMMSAFVFAAQMVNFPRGTGRFRAFAGWSAGGCGAGSMGGRGGHRRRVDRAVLPLR